MLSFAPAGTPLLLLLPLLISHPPPAPRLLLLIYFHSQSVLAMPPFERCVAFFDMFSSTIVGEKKLALKGFTDVVRAVLENSPTALAPASFAHSIAQRIFTAQAILAAKVDAAAAMRGGGESVTNSSSSSSPHAASEGLDLIDFFAVVTSTTILCKALDMTLPIDDARISALLELHQQYFEAIDVEGGDAFSPLRSGSPVASRFSPMGSPPSPAATAAARTWE